MAKHISNSVEITRVVNKAIASGVWCLERSKGHGKLRHNSGRLVVFAMSASDHRAPNNLARDIRHVECGMPAWGQPNEAVGVVMNSKKRDNSLTY